MINKVLEKSFSGALFFCIQSEAKGFSVDLPDQIFYNSSNPVTTDNQGAKQMHDKLTQSDIRKMEEEIEYRKLVVRKEALEAVKEARAHGDLSENFEYHAAKKDKNQNESRIRYLEKMVRTAQVISEDSADDEVGMNNTVELYFEEDDETEVYKIVTTIRENSLENKISTESPLGKAIFKHKAGDRVFVQVGTNNGYYVVIKSIDKSTDDSEDKIRRY